uniref:DNA-directed RNA polymerase III subunit RPC5 n=1 Tax=Lactuca sativa TaxID=4236 RepID=A0A9R1XFQ4_LACSA|nr:hypothetical protein LSAT_V11C400216090 [Lactuca sativa]
MDLDDAKPPPVSTMYTVPPPHDANGNVNMDTHATQLNAGDQVVREIDVLHTSSADVNSKLYVLQYPLRQQWRPHNLQERCKKVKLNPQTAEVKIDLNVDGDKAMANQVLSTSWKPPSIADYAVGILKGNELHLKYVNAVVKLRPSMQHLKPLKKMNTSHAEVDMIDSEDIKEEKDIKQRKLNEQNEDTKEPVLFFSGVDFSQIPCALLKLPLEERYKTMLSEGRPLQFNTFKHIAPDSNVEDIFKVLQSHAQLVQGLWVSKCKLKYDEDGGKNVLIRDYMMLLFSKNPIVRDTQLPEAPEKMKDILHKFASRRECFKDWKFKELRDDLFIKEYPNIVEEQKKIWDHMEPQLIECLISKNLKHGIDHMRTTLTINNNNNNNKNNVETKTTSVSTPSRGVKLDETQEALIKVFKYQKHITFTFLYKNQLGRIFKKYFLIEKKSTMILNKIHQRLRVMNVNTSQEELLKTLNQVAVNIHGVFVSKSSSDHPQYDDFRNVVINLLVAQGPKARLRRGSIEAAASMQLKRVPNNTEFRKVITEMCTSQSSRWVLKSGD